MDQRHGQANMPQQNYPQAGQDYYVDHTQADDDPFPLLDYLQILWFRRRLIIAVSLFVAIIGFIHVNQLVPIYTATSTLMIGANETQVVDIEQVLSRDNFGY